MNNEGNKGKRQRIATRKTAGVRRFSEERLEQFEREQAFRRDGDEERPRKSFRPRRDDDRREPFGGRKESGFGGGRSRSFGDRPVRERRDERDENRSFKGSDERRPKRSFGENRDDDRPYGNRRNARGAARNEREFDKTRSNDRQERKGNSERRGGGGGFKRREKDPLYDRPRATGQIRLNKYLADSGICSRREADDLILAGAVTVNGVVVTELGTKVNTTDKVVYGGETLNREKLRYVLLNKPKGVITTSDDPYERHTVMELVQDACSERIYPVGRLDRNTIGLLLLTNDGDLAKTLTHPSHEVKKLYHATLDKPLTKNDLMKIKEGLILEDGPIEVDGIDWVVDDPTKREVGIEIHSGRNHIVRRIFESLGYEVVKLDRVMFAGLTKHMLPRGHWRFLTPSEISILKRIK
ncbi:MAG: pseudouridine synthase [Bacteroidales bacterium]|nr:pseudouridine synthase [Bacteroidales bacterium]